MRTIFGTLALGMTLAATPALADDSNGYYLNGVVGAEYLSGSGLDQGFGLVDLRFGFDPVSYGSLPGMGFEVGVSAFGGFGTPVQSAYFAALTFDLGGGRLHVGAPRNAVHGFNTTPLPGGSLVAMAELGLYSGHMPYSTLASMTLNRPALGLRYERSHGDLSYAVSALRLSQGGNHVDDFAFGIAYRFGNSRVFGTVETLRSSGGGGAPTLATIGGSTLVGAEGRGLGPIELGGSLTHVSGGMTSDVVATLYATLRPTDRLGVTAAVTRLPGTTLVGLAAEYEVWNGVAVNAGVLRAPGGSALWSLGLSRRF